MTLTENIFVSIMFILIVAAFTIPFMLISQFIFMVILVSDVPPWAILFCLLFGSLIGIPLTSLKITGRHYWKLTDHHLVSGVLFKKKYPLQSITKIVEGLPEVSPKSLKGKLFGNTGQLITSMNRSSSLFIKFDDNSFLPLNVHGLINGSIMMSELVKRFDQLIDESYIITPEEQHVLDKNEYNYLLKAKA